MSSPDDSAAKEANRQEEERQASISRSQQRINQVFDDPRRQGEIADLENATREYYTQDLDRQKADTDRELKFALARGGLTGGSTQVDQQRRLGEDYSRGLLEVDNRARGAGADLRASDEQSRAELIRLATNGMDTSTAAQRSAEQMRVGLDSARATSTAEGLGDVFVTAKPFAQRSRDDASRRQAVYDAGRDLYGPSSLTSPYFGGP